MMLAEQNPERYRECLVMALVAISRNGRSATRRHLMSIIQHTKDEDKAAGAEYVLDAVTLLNRASVLTEKWPT